MDAGEHNALQHPRVLGDDAEEFDSTPDGGTTEET